MISKWLNQPIVLLDLLCIVIYSIAFANLDIYIAGALSFGVMIFAETYLRDKKE